MKSKLILSFFTIFITISPVLAQNLPVLPEEPKNNIELAFEVVLAGSRCQASLNILGAIIRNTSSVNSYVKLRFEPLDQIEKKLNNEIERIEKELPAYRRVIQLAKFMPHGLLSQTEKYTRFQTTQAINQMGIKAGQSDQFQEFINRLFKESEICVDKFDKLKKKVNL